MSKLATDDDISLKKYLIALFVSFSMNCMAEMPSLNSTNTQQLFIQINGAIREAAKIPEDLQIYVATVAEPKRIELPINESVYDAVKKRCGDTSDAYFEKIKDLNKEINLNAEDKVREILIPACIPSINPRIITAKLGDNPTKISQSYLYFNSPSELPGLAKKIIKLNRVKNPNRDIKANNDVFLPQAYAATNIKIDTFKTSPTNVKETLLEKFKDTELEVTIDNSESEQKFSTITDVDEEELESTCKDSDKESSKYYPFFKEITIAILNLYFAVDNETSDQKNLSAPVVGIIDTGLDGIGPIFKEEWFHKANIFDPRNLNRKCKLLFYGSNPQGDKNTGFCPWYSDKNTGEKWHGTKVTDLALGSLDFRNNSIRDPGDYIKLQEFRALQAINLSQSEPRFYINNESIVKSNYFTRERNISIINISLTSPTNITEFLSYYVNSNTLIVAAAGNDKKKLGSSGSAQVYPASYGGTGDLKNNLITVVAHDVNKRKPNYSNYSARYADIASPGCAIKAHAIDESGAVVSSSVSGTSFAAPFVTFTAAILKTFGINSPKEIKNRIYAGSDYDKYWEPFVFSSGTLNIPKTIAIFDDVLVSNDKPDEIILGEWGALESNITLCKMSDPIERKQMIKLTPVVDKQELKLRITTQNSLGDLEVDSACVPYSETTKFKIMKRFNSEKLTFENVNEEIELPWKNVRDIVLKYNARQ